MRKPPHITFLSACTEKRLAQSRTGVWEGLTPAVAFRPREPRQTEQAPPAKKGIFRKDTTQGMPRVSSCGNLSDGQDGRGLCPSRESTEKDGSFAGDTNTNPLTSRQVCLVPRGLSASVAAGPRDNLTNTRALTLGRVSPNPAF